ncbi:MAG: hypothetical protein AAGE94_17740 [Acidobacteriota bacterium]
MAHNAAFEGDDTAFSATPAVSDGELFVRSEGFLYRIAKASAAAKPSTDAPAVESTDSSLDRTSER